MCADGFDVAALIAYKQAGGNVGDFAQGEPCSADALLDVPSDIWIPAAPPDVLRADNVDRLITWVVAQGANIPATPGAAGQLTDRPAAGGEVRCSKPSTVGSR